MSSQTNKDDTETMRVKVVVIGAGASGLMCTRSLVKKGVVSLDEIVVLEARDRVGGRIHTTLETNGDSSELYRDHGAAWVHGTGFDWPRYCSPLQSSGKKADDENHSPKNNPMMELLQEVTLEGENVCLTHLQPTFKLGNPWMRPGHVLIDPQNLILFVDGKRIGGEDNQNGNVIVKEALKMHYEIMNKVGHLGYDLIVNGKSNETVQQSFQHCLDQVLPDKTILPNTDENPGPTSNTQLIPVVAAFFRHLIEAWHGTSASGLQLSEFSACGPDDDAQADDEWTDEGDFYGPHCTLQRGMQTVLEPLLETVSSCIRLKQSVRCVRHQEADTIRVEASSGVILEADYCVVTVSLGCLAHCFGKETRGNDESGVITFSPDLSCTKVSAIQRMCMGSYKKVFLSFDRVFWPAKEPFLGLIRGSPGEYKADNGLGSFMLLDNLWACKGIPCIEAVLIGDAGKWATGKSDATIRNAVLKFLANSMGFDFERELKVWCIDCHITRWEEDPYSRGAYSGYRLGTLEEHTEGLAASEWDGRLLFAGEATLSGYEGSVHAALISGVNVADEIECEMRRGL